MTFLDVLQSSRIIIKLLSAEELTTSSNDIRRVVVGPGIGLALLGVVVIMEVVFGSTLPSAEGVPSESQTPLRQLPSEKVKGPQAKGTLATLELTLELEKDTFVTGEKLKAFLSLSNTGNKEVLIEHFPTAPFGLLLYDKDGHLVETWRGHLAESMVRSDILKLEAGKSFTKNLDFPLEHKPGPYQLAAAFIGVIINAERHPDILEGGRSAYLPEAKALLITERISITIN